MHAARDPACEKWVTHRARESWRGKWTDKLFAQLLPQIEGDGHEVLACVAKNNLALQTEDLIRAHGPAQVIDARRPKQSAAPWAPGAASAKPSQAKRIVRLVSVLGRIKLSGF